MTATDVDQWLADRVPRVLRALGGSLERGGIDGEVLGWVEGTLVPEDSTGVVLGVALGAAMVAAVDVVEMSARPSASLSAMTIEIARDPRRGETLSLRGEVVSLTRTRASAEAVLLDAAGVVVARSTATLSRPPRG